MSIIWKPTEARVKEANVTRLLGKAGLASTDELLARSIAQPEWFWAEVVRDLDIEFLSPYGQVLDVSSGAEWAKWFVGGKFNVTHNCVDRWANRTPDAMAVVWEGEDGDVRRLTYRELGVMVDRAAYGLSALGLGDGTRVGLFLPMMPEAVAMMFACAKIGAITVPMFSGYGPDALTARLRDADVRALAIADGFLRRGRSVHMKEVADLAVESVPGLEHLVVCERLGLPRLPWKAERDVRWEDLVQGDGGGAKTSPLDSEHPLMIVYTSGTTGRPKGAVHVHAGFLVKTAEELAYQLDVRRGDILYWMSDLGWLMGPWAIMGALALGTTVFIYEGAPDHPRPTRLWEMVERHGITTLGVSPSLIRTLIPSGSEEIRNHDLSSLRILGSAGEPWDPQAYGWYFSEVGQGRCPIINLSGGTEVGACFLSPLPVDELKPCTLRRPALGMDMDVWRADGVRAQPGEVGELVCKAPWPAMTRGIWGNPERYLTTYWSRWPGVWVHGDWASIDEDGFWFLHGRSDETLNVAGKRVGSGEVESAVACHPAVLQSAVIGVPHPTKGEAIWCFVVLRPEQEGDDRMAAEIAEEVVRRLGRPFRPASVLFVDDLPRTRTSKILRRAIRSMVLGVDPGDLSSLENPGALEAIRGLSRLEEAPT